MAILERHLHEARRGNGGLVLLSGEAGIGKTRLADEISRSAAASGWVVAWGRSWEGEGTPAYWPWLQVLRALRASLPAPFDEALATSPELASLVAVERTVARPADPHQARFRLFDAVSQLLHAASEQKPLLVVLDDVHAADVASQLLAQFVARDLRGARVLLLTTARDEAPPSHDTGAEVLAQLAREGTHLPLGRLSRDDLARWVEALGPSSVSKVDALFATSEGNPLFAHELLLAAARHPEAVGTSAMRPLGIREAVRAHLASVPGDTLRVLETAAVIGRDFSVPVLRALSPGDDAGTHLERAITAGIVVDMGAESMRFSHVLLRDELYGRAGPRRAEVHRAIATRVEEAPEAARHALLGARPEDAARTARLVLAAMRDGSDRLAFEDSAELGQRALSLLGAYLEPADAGRLWLAVAEARALAGKDDLGACARASEIAEAIPDAELLARAALVAASELTMNRRDGVIALLRRALAGQGDVDSPLRAELMARLAAAIVPPLPHEFAERARLADESVAMARRLGDPPTLFHVLRLGMVAFPESFAARQRAEVMSESITLARRLGQVARVVQLFAPQVACCLELGDPDGAAREVDEAEELLSRLPQPHYQWRVPLLRALLAALAGRFAEADAEGRAALKIAQDHDVREGVTMFCVQRIGNQYVRGDGDGYEEFDAFTTRVMAQNPLRPLFRALQDALCGRMEDARSALAMARARDPSTIPGLYALAWAGLHAGISDHAEFFHGALAPRHARESMFFGPGSLLSMGPTALLLGRLEAALGRVEDAHAHYEQALVVARRIRSPPYVAQTELALAELLAPRSAAEARPHAEAAGALAAELGMRAVGEGARALLSRVRPSAAVAPPPPPVTVVSLTREGELWWLASPAKRISLKNTKGLSYLEALVRDPHREIHALELEGSDDGDAGPLLDEHAKRAYRERAESLREQLEEATRCADLGRAERAREELDALAGELARAVGLGGRDRRAGSATERARVNVQRRLRDVIKRVREQDAKLGRHLEVSVRTGFFCVYTPSWPD